MSNEHLYKRTITLSLNLTEDQWQEFTDAVGQTYPYEGFTKMWDRCNEILDEIRGDEPE